MTPSIPGYTADELESLTPEELSALESDSGDNEAELTEIAAEGTEDAATGTTDVVEAVAEEPPEPASEATGYVAQAPADAATQLEALKQQKAAAKAEDRAAFKQLNDGEIDFDAYEAIKNKADEATEAANDKMADIQKAISKAEISAEMAQQETVRTWKSELGNVMTAAKAEGLDYKDAALGKEFDGLLRAFGQEASSQGMSDEGLKASKWALQQAHEVMKVRHADKLVAKPAAGKPAATTATAAARHSLTTLSSMPNADRALGDNDAISKFSALEGDDLERALAGMSKAEVDKLMASV